MLCWVIAPVLGAVLYAGVSPAPSAPVQTPQPLNALALLGERFADAYFPLAKEPAGKNDKAPLSLTYIANMGVLIDSGGTKVLIDALFDKPNPEYRAPASETLEKIIKGEAPYDGVKLALVTHNHPDHFAPGVAIRFLESQPKAILLAPADAVAELRKAASDWTRLEPRVISLDLKVGEIKKTAAAGLPLTAVRTLHGRSESPMNLMYLFDLNGRSIFHEGDSPGKPETFKGFGLETASIDLAVLHYWFPFEPNIAKYLQEVFTPDHIALTHLPVKDEGSMLGNVDQARQFYKDIFLLLPGMAPVVIAPDGKRVYFKAPRVLPDGKWVVVSQHFSFAETN